MKKFQVTVVVTHRYSVEVEADDWDDCNDKLDEMKLNDFNLDDEPDSKELDYVETVGEL